MDGVALREQQNFAHDILQLAHVARPVLSPKKFQGLGMDRWVGDAQLDRIFAQKIFHQFRDILFPLAQVLHLRVGGRVYTFEGDLLWGLSGGVSLTL